MFSYKQSNDTLTLVIDAVMNQMVLYHEDIGCLVSLKVSKCNGNLNFMGIFVNMIELQAIILQIIFRNLNRWKEWRQQRQSRRQNHAASDVADSQVASDDESGDVPDGGLCVICLTRRRRSAFIPCGHLACCQRCVRSIEREVTPKCPVCRQQIRNSVRIYDS